MRCSEECGYGVPALVGEALGALGLDQLGALGLEHWLGSGGICALVERVCDTARLGRTL